jgi:hypothetical protein
VPEGEVNTAKVGAMQLRSSELKGDRHNVYNKDTLFRPTGPKVSMMDRIIGTWRLIDEIAQDQDGKPLPTLFGPDPMGLVIFTEAGRMMAAISDGATDAIDANRNHVFYYGSFTFDDNQLVTVVEGSSDPIWQESQQIRDARFDGGYLILSPPTGLLGPLDVRRDLTWERIA